MQRRLDYPEKPERTAMNTHLKRGLITLPIQARRAMRVPEQKLLVSLFFKTGLITYLSIAAPLGHAEELGRLFFTPQQRAQLEYSQKQNGDSPNNASVLTVNGIVQRRGGERTVWINGVPQLAGKSDEQAPDSLPVAVPGQSKPVKVKVGQKLILDQPARPNLPASAPQKQPADDD